MVALWAACGGDGANRLHGLCREGGSVVEPTRDHRTAEGEKDAKGIDSDNRHAGDHEGDQRPEVAECPGPFHAIEAVRGHQDASLAASSLLGRPNDWRRPERQPNLLAADPAATTGTLVTRPVNDGASR